MAFDDDMFEVWLREYKEIIKDPEPVRHQRGAYNPYMHSSTTQYELYQSYYTGANGFLPDHYVGDLQGFDLFVDHQTKTYMVKYNQYYVIIPEHLFDLAFTEMDAGELNLFLCKALFDNIDVTAYLTSFLKGQRQYDYLKSNGSYRPLTDEEREERQRQHDEALRLKQEEEDRKLQEQIEYMREHEACTRLTTSLRADFWGLILVEDML